MCKYIYILGPWLFLCEVCIFSSCSSSNPSVQWHVDQLVTLICHVIVCQPCDELAICPGSKSMSAGIGCDPSTLQPLKPQQNMYWHTVYWKYDVVS